MMPHLFSLGQHKALVRAQSQLAPEEVLLAFLDDVDTISITHSILDKALWSEARIRVHQGKIQIWARSLRGGDLESGSHGSGVAWIPPHKRGMKVLGTPLGHADFLITFHR